MQSVVLGGTLLTLGTLAMMLGLIADLIGRNRQLLEQTLERVRVLEDAVAENNSEPHNIVALKNDSASAKSRAV